MDTKSGRFGALAGIAAAALAIGAAELVAVLTGARSAPLVAVGGVVVDTVPEPLKQFAIDLFGVHDKTALLVGTAILLAAFAALIGVVAVRSLPLGLAGIGLFAALGVAAAVTRPHAGPAAVLPSLVGSGLAAGVLWLFTVGPLEIPGIAETTRGGAGAGWRPPITEPAGEPVGNERSRAAAIGEPAGGERPDIAVATGEPVGGDRAEAATTGKPAGQRPGADSAEIPVIREWGAGHAGDTRDGFPDHEEMREGRRRFLTGVGATLGLAAIGGFTGRWLSTRRGVSEARAAVVLPSPASPAPPVPAGVDLELGQLSPYRTSNSRFYRIDTALVVPQVDPENWQLRIHGRVRKPITLSYAELLARPMIERDITLACVSNEVGGDLIGNARWLGVPLKDLLDEAGPLDGADQVVGRSVDGFTCGTPTAVMRDGRDAMLAVGMNGDPLPIEHGFPVRVVVPGLYGYVSACKWIVELELTSFADYDAYWVPRGWSPQGPIKTQSRIDTPRPRNSLPAGQVTVAGVAWAQHRGVQRVEVRVDDGPWRQATLAAAASIDTWVQWSWTWAAAAGEHTLQVRATDATGEVQSERQQSVAPDGATGWHTVQITIR